MVKIFLFAALAVFTAGSIVQAQNKPDLTVKGEVFALAEKIFPGNLVSFGVKVENIGDQAADDFTVLLNFNGVNQCRSQISLEPGQTDTAWCGYRAKQTGDLNVEAVVDPFYNAVEVNEFNNTASHKFYVSPAEERPDISVSKIKSLPDIIHTGDDVLFSVLLTNKSKWPTDSFASDWYIDGSKNAICSERISLQPNKSKKVTCLIKNLSNTENISVFFITDQYNRLAETDEKNNSFSGKFQVLPARNQPFEYVTTQNMLGTSDSLEENLTSSSGNSSTNQEQINSNPPESLQINRDPLLESHVWQKYMQELLEGQPIQPFAIEKAMFDFVTYGVDENTTKLGLGERAAVLYSYKEAYNKIPSTAEEMSDVIRIASGRWPAELSIKAQDKAHAEFYKIYKRIADMNNQNDNAAITIMSYGLRQRAANRNLDSEKAGMKIFKSIYGHMPQTTRGWNIMQAITYSGATK